MSEKLNFEARDKWQPAPRKSERTREAILGAALEFLRTRPFRELTVAVLMARAGASRPAFYQYFSDLHELMETLLSGMRDDILDGARPWFEGEGDPVALLDESLGGLVKICHARGPILRAVTDAAASDAKLEQDWAEFLRVFDNAVTARIEQHQAQGLIPIFPARPVAVALNRLDASFMIDQFGRPPYGDPQEVHAALTRVWTSTLYGSLGCAETAARMVHLREKGNIP